ncbi:hypothetical protein OIO90_000054 [Microbotryomycetes sp. JL221]|nr:hypothetical protein OIO90_000054 [Microbotryomycetes sp. JL221]
MVDVDMLTLSDSDEDRHWSMSTTLEITPAATSAEAPPTPETRAAQQVPETISLLSSTPLGSTKLDGRFVRGSSGLTPRASPSTLTLDDHTPAVTAPKPSWTQHDKISNTSAPTKMIETIELLDSSDDEGEHGTPSRNAWRSAPTLDNMYRENRSSPYRNPRQPGRSSTDSSTGRNIDRKGSASTQRAPHETSSKSSTRSSQPASVDEDEDELPTLDRLSVAYRARMTSVGRIKERFFSPIRQTLTPEKLASSSRDLIDAFPTSLPKSGEQPAQPDAASSQTLSGSVRKPSNSPVKASPTKFQDTLRRLSEIDRILEPARGHSTISTSNQIRPKSTSQEAPDGSIASYDIKPQTTPRRINQDSQVASPHVSPTLGLAKQTAANGLAGEPLWTSDTGSLQVTQPRASSSSTDLASKQSDSQLHPTQSSTTNATSDNITGTSLFEAREASLVSQPSTASTAVAPPKAVAVDVLQDQDATVETMASRSRSADAKSVSLAQSEGSLTSLPSLDVAPFRKDAPAHHNSEQLTQSGPFSGEAPANGKRKTARKSNGKALRVMPSLTSESEGQGDDEDESEVDHEVDHGSKPRSAEQEQELSEVDELVSDTDSEDGQPLSGTHSAQDPVGSMHFDDVDVRDPSRGLAPAEPVDMDMDDTGYLLPSKVSAKRKGKLKDTVQMTKTIYREVVSTETDFATALKLAQDTLSIQLGAMDQPRQTMLLPEGDVTMSALSEVKIDKSGSIGQTRRARKSAGGRLSRRASDATVAVPDSAEENETSSDEEDAIEHWPASLTEDRSVNIAVDNSEAQVVETRAEQLTATTQHIGVKSRPVRRKTAEQLLIDETRKQIEERTRRAFNNVDGREVESEDAMIDNALQARQYPLRSKLQTGRKSTSSLKKRQMNVTEITRTTTNATANGIVQPEILVEDDWTRVDIIRKLAKMQKRVYTKEHLAQAEKEFKAKEKRKRDSDNISARQIAGPAFDDEFLERTEYLKILVKELTKYEDKPINKLWNRGHTIIYERAANEAISDEVAVLYDARGSPLPLPRVHVVPLDDGEGPFAPPFELIYTHRIVYRDGVVPLQSPGCSCQGNCGSKFNRTRCQCRLRQQFFSQKRTGDTASERSNKVDFAYTREKRIKQSVLDTKEPIWVVGQIPRISVEIFRTEKRGWAVRNPFRYDYQLPQGEWQEHDEVVIQKGTPLGIYSSEMISNDEGTKRTEEFYVSKHVQDVPSTGTHSPSIEQNELGRNYVFDLDHYHINEDLQYLDKLFGRDKIYVDEGALDRPLNVLVAVKDILPGEEIATTYSGRSPVLQPGQTLQEYQAAADKKRQEVDPSWRCYCGDELCKGSMYGNLEDDDGSDESE